MQADEGKENQRSKIRISIEDMIALGIRAVKSPNLPPRLVYQELPESAMTLIATVPRATPAVSIPQLNGIYPILREQPKESKAIVVIYVQKPDHRYVAEEVLYAGRSFSSARFFEFAARQVRKNLGGLRPVPGRYAYFSPSRDQWQLILSDGGYTVLDPSTMVFDINPEIVNSRQDPLSSGVTARIPVQTGQRSPVSRLFAAFARVEITLVPNPNPESAWTCFAEFRRARVKQSRPPASIAPEFQEWVQLLAEESGFKSWHFRRGMLCGDPIEWWGFRSRRRTLHEGIDFAEGSPLNAATPNIPEGTPVRALTEGEAVGILDDYLNKTVIVRHPAIQNESGSVFHTLFSHIHPAITIPSPVRKGQLLGNVGKSGKTGAPAHLHLTGAWVPEGIPSDKITMDLIHPGFMPIVLVNFNSSISSG